MATIYNLKDASQILPMWVADMDFPVAKEITEALHSHLEHPIFGYSYVGEEATQAVISWLENRHNWSVSKDSILYRHGVIPAMANIITAFTEPGDKVLVSTPVYPPFFNVPKNNGREAVHCPLIEQDGHCTYDFAAFEQALAQDVKVYILCNPHNPGGFVWDIPTLKEIIRLCAKYDVLIISDEIHADIMLDGAKHTPLATIAGDEIDRIITCMAPTKTFNLASIQVAYMIVTDKKKRTKLEAINAANGYGELNSFAPVAMHAAYTKGDTWLTDMLAYISKNMDYVIQELTQLEGIAIKKPQGTYLLWIDYRKTNLSEKEIMNLLLSKGQLALEPGTKYGKEGNGFLRINVACSFETIKDGVERFKKALQ